MNMIQHENMLLKQRVEELQKQVSDLSTTNEFLLDQNAQLRMGVKQPTCATTVVNAVPATQITVPQPTAGVISVQPAAISMGGQPTPTISLAGVKIILKLYYELYSMHDVNLMFRDCFKNFTKEKVVFFPFHEILKFQERKGRVFSIS